MEMFIDFLFFVLKAFTIVILIFVPIFLISISRKSKEENLGELKIKNLSNQYKTMANSLKVLNLNKDETKKFIKAEKKQFKASLKGGSKAKKKPVYVLDFEGDIEASSVESLREEINAILNSETKCEEIILRLESRGGTVIGYGLCAAQLQRIRDANIKLTACVDKVAASGGYMMACVADKIISAPFAVIGSIGVVAAIPNFHKILKKNDIDYELHTAGEFKRTITTFGETTEEGRTKFKEDLEDIHKLFKDHVSKFRPELDISKIATGEVWEGIEALEVGLVDELKTSDEYILDFAKKHDVYSITYEIKENISDKFNKFFKLLIKDSLGSIEDYFEKRKFK
ncbi:MAG: protease SohB [Gammaproteobacteria bacterium]|tara:strand:- start:1293 stop:2318 length:1026 start_codon:yes stop_codon:yes gene_type:complete